MKLSVGTAPQWSFTESRYAPGCTGNTGLMASRLMAPGGEVPRIEHLSPYGRG